LFNVRPNFVEGGDFLRIYFPHLPPSFQRVLQKQVLYRSKRIPLPFPVAMLVKRGAVHSVPMEVAAARWGDPITARERRNGGK
jgi:hypothetical protein